MRRCGVVLVLAAFISCSSSWTSSPSRPCTANRFGRCDRWSLPRRPTAAACPADSRPEWCRRPAVAAVAAAAAAVAVGVDIDRHIAVR